MHQTRITSTTVHLVSKYTIKVIVKSKLSCKIVGTFEASVTPVRTFPKDSPVDPDLSRVQLFQFWKHFPEFFVSVPNCPKTRVQLLAGFPRFWKSLSSVRSRFYTQTRSLVSLDIVVRHGFEGVICGAGTVVSQLRWNNTYWNECYYRSYDNDHDDHGDDEHFPPNRKDFWKQSLEKKYVISFV